MPYCVRKCRYCDFVSYVGREDTADKYADSVINELYQYDLSGYEIKTIFFGGGTPTAVNPEAVGKILSAIGQKCTVSSAAEITTEANPCTLTAEKLKKYLSYGINRLSMGVQSFDDDVLKTLGRVHNADAARKAFILAREAGFNNISIDLMLAIPGQTEDNLAETLRIATELCPEHISLYSLILEDGTPLTNSVENGELTAVDDDTDRRMYRYSVRSLDANGYKQYEVSNFAKAGFESRHNICYWERGDYIGLGCAAHSFFEGVRYSNTESLDEYLKGVSVAENIGCGDAVDNIGAAEETVMLGLRMNKGFDALKLQRETGIDVLDASGEQIQLLIKEGLLEYTDGRIKATDRGFDVLNGIIYKITENFR